MAVAGVSGTDEFVRLAAHLKATDKEMSKAFLRAIRDAGKPVKEDVRAGVRATFPNRGGLASRAAGVNVGIRTRATGKKAGIRLQATGSKRSVTTRTLAGIDSSGTWRHPVYGRPKSFVSQTDSRAEGWWSEEVPDHKPDIQAKILDAMQDVNRQIVRGI